MAGYIGSKAVSVNTTSATISDDLAVGDDATITGDLDVDGTTNLDATNIVGDLTVTGDTATFTSANADDPILILQNTTNNTNSARLRFVKDKGAAGADNDIAGVIEFFADDDNQDNILFAKIVAQVADASNGAEGGKLSIGVATHDGEPQFGLILADGNAEDEVDVTIGNGTSSLTSVVGNIDVTGTAQIDGAITSNGNLTISNASSPTINITDTTNTTTLALRATDSNVLVRSTGNHPLVLNTNQTDRMTVETNGNVTIEDGNLVIATDGHGINFSGPTAQSGGTSQTLDSYEEGLFAAVLAPTSSGSIALEGASNSFSYTKIGRLVTVTGRAQIASVSSPSGDLKITGLPFTVGDVGDNAGDSTVLINFLDDSGGTQTVIPSRALDAGTQIDIKKGASGVAANDQFYISFSYITA